MHQPLAIAYRESVCHGNSEIVPHLQALLDCDSLYPPPVDAAERAWRAGTHANAVYVEAKTIFLRNDTFTAVLALPNQAKGPSRYPDDA